MRNLSILVGVLTLAGCASAPSSHKTAFAEAEEREKRNLDLLWDDELPGIVSRLMVSRDGSHVLLSTVPPYAGAQRDGMAGPNLSFYSSKGELKFRKDLPYPVMGLEMTHNAEVLLVRTVDRTLHAFDQSGQLLWKVGGGCLPYVLEESREILCFFPLRIRNGLAFEVLNWKGQSLHKERSKERVRMFRVSLDRKSFGVSYEGGRLMVYGPNRKVVTQKSYPGEVVDFDISGGMNPKTYVLYLSGKEIKKKKGMERRLAVFEGSKSLADLKLETHAQRIKTSASGEQGFLYGNGPKGQHLAMIEPKVQAKPTWKYHNPRFADFTPEMKWSPDRLIVGFEDTSEAFAEDYHAHLFGFNFQGQVQWDLPLDTIEGSYLYDQGQSGDQPFVVVATDKTNIEAYRVD